MDQTPDDSLGLAHSHLERVRVAWNEPADWADLSTYGFYCLEAAIVAAALHLGWRRPSTHRAKEAAAQRLHAEHGLPDTADLLFALNQTRKHEAYGDTDRPEDLDPEDIVITIEEYVESVEALLAQ